jgi:hypothetical protein
MVPPVKYWLVGGYVHEGTTRKDIDIMAVLEPREFELAFGYDHASLMDAFKEEPRHWKLKRYLNANRMSGWTLAKLFGKKVDFKWALPTMLYGRRVELNIELDVLKHFDKCDIHL